MRTLTEKEIWTICVWCRDQARCLSRHIGTVLMNADETEAIGIGWNGPPCELPMCNQGWYAKMIGRVINECPRKNMGYPSGEGLQYCIAVHAERSAILHAARRGESTQGSRLYMTCGVPCTPCLVEIIDAGVQEIICTETDKFYDVQSEYSLTESKLSIRKWRLEEANA